MEEYEAVIVGGGVWGASIAYHLALAGLKRILVLERDSLGSGATSRSSGIIRQSYDDPVLAKMARDSLHVFEGFGSQIGGDSEFAETGFLTVSPDVGRLQSRVKALKSLGIRIRLLDAREAREIGRELETRDGEAFAFEEDAGVANPTSTLRSFASEAARLGVTVRERAPVTKIDVAQGRVTGVAAGGVRYRAPVVVDAAGAWSGAVARLAGIEIPVKPVIRYIVKLACPDGMKVPKSVVLDESADVYLMPEGRKSNGVLIGGGAETLNFESAAEVDPENYDRQVPEEVIADRARKVSLRYPGIGEARVGASYTGVIDYTPDRRPILSTVPSVQGLYLACGSSSHGFKFSPIVGKAMAELITTGSVDTIDAGYFSLSRFDTH